MRMKLLFVQGNDSVKEIAATKKVNHSIVDIDLADKTGLLTTLTYETKNRRPYNIVHIGFQRITFNKLGVFSFSEQVTSESVRVQLQYAFYDSLGNEPLPLPIAPELPNKEELDVLKTYIINKYPILLQNNPYVFTNSIKRKKELHLQQIQQMKKSHEL